MKSRRASCSRPTAAACHRGGPWGGGGGGALRSGMEGGTWGHEGLGLNVLPNAMMRGSKFPLGKKQELAAEIVSHNKHSYRSYSVMTLL